MYSEYNVSVSYKGYRIEFSEEKNLLLKETREIGFEDVIVAIEEKKILGDLRHSNEKYAHQRILVIKRKNYAYAVPYIIDPKKKVIFLKTIYPSRILTNKFMKGGCQKMNAVLNKYEQEIEDAIGKGEFVNAPNLEATKEMFLEAAKNFRQLQETKSITLRVNLEDLIKVKAKAKRNGIAYQTLISLLIRQYIKGETEVIL